MPEIQLTPRHVVATYGHGIGQIEATCTCGVSFGYRSREADLLADVEKHRAEVLPYEEAEAELLAAVTGAVGFLDRNSAQAKRLWKALTNYRKVRG